MTAIFPALTDIVTVVAVIVAARQLVLSQRQSVTNFEDSFAKEYRELVCKLPIKALLGEVLTDEEHALCFDEMYHYFDLCNQQVFHRNTGRITDSTWTFWRDGMTSNLKRPAFKRAWFEIATKANGDFSELREIFPPDELRR
jgi:hypothetical protein